MTPARLHLGLLGLLLGMAACGSNADAPPCCGEPNAGGGSVAAGTSAGGASVGGASAGSSSIAGSANGTSAGSSGASGASAVAGGGSESGGAFGAGACGTAGATGAGAAGAPAGTTGTLPARQRRRVQGVPECGCAGSAVTCLAGAAHAMIGPPVERAVSESGRCQSNAPSCSFASID
jgi:hypothetical protein